MASRIILHVDMDYFFAQIEERENPKLKNKPVAVCIISDREKSSGAVAACNYLARASGVKAGMACVMAKKACKDLVIISARKKYYDSVSDEVMSLISKYATSFEQVSIDEAYLDVTHLTAYPKLDAYLREIKDAVMDAQNLTCSIGAGPNKLISKIAASENKPDGVKIVLPEDAEKYLDKKNISEIHGLGKKSQELLMKKGIEKVSQLKNLKVAELVELFGKIRGPKLYHHARGIDESEVRFRRKGQYGRLQSLKVETSNPADIIPSFEVLISEVHEMIKKDGRDFRTITVHFIDYELRETTKSITLPLQSSDYNTLHKNAIAIIDEYLILGNALRRVGVTLSNLSDKKGQKSITDYTL
jgi:DNA polymerase IV (archaeal DinB-like DNA polymerase)